MVGVNQKNREAAALGPQDDDDDICWHDSDTSARLGDFGWNRLRCGKLAIRCDGYTPTLLLFLLRIRDDGVGRLDDWRG